MALNGTPRAVPLVGTSRLPKPAGPPSGSDDTILSVRIAPLPQVIWTLDV